MHIAHKAIISNYPYLSQENLALAQKTTHLNDYYETLRSNFISMLDHVRLPNFPTEKPTPDNFDSYLSAVHKICFEIQQKQQM